MSDWNPRYVAYANSFSLAPEAMLARDKNEFPGGHMAGFMFWIRERWRAWDREQGYDHRVRHEMRPEGDHPLFDAWLLAKHPPPVPTHPESPQMSLFEVP